MCLPVTIYSCVPIDSFPPILFLEKHEMICMDKKVSPVVVPNSFFTSGAGKCLMGAFPPYLWATKPVLLTVKHIYQ